MKKLIIRLLVLILSVYVAGSIYPLFAHEAGHSHGPAPSGPAPPAPPPPSVPSSPGMLDTKGPQLQPPPPQDSGGGGCFGGGGTAAPQPLREPTYVRAGNALSTVTGLQRDLDNLRRQKEDVMPGVLSSPDEIAQIKALNQNIKDKEAELRKAIDSFNENFISYGTLKPDASNLGTVKTKVKADEKLYKD